MFAICSVSPNVNGVRKHVRTMKEKGQSFRVVQIPTDEYRRMHKMSKSDEKIRDFMDKVNEMDNTHKIDIDELTIHTIDCEHAGNGCADASITDMNTVGLTKCECIG